MLISIVGATASGKSALSLAVARELGGPSAVEIISADAMQLYRGMDIGTAKLPIEERAGIEHHQIDVLDISQEASVAAYQRDARADIASIWSKGKVPIIVGGSGLYVSAVLDELDFPGTDPQIRAELEAQYRREGLAPLVEELERTDPVSYRTLDLHNPRRVIRALEVVRLTGHSYTPVFPRHTSHYPDVSIVGLEVAKPILDELIEKRARQMFEGGLIEETQVLIEQGLLESPTAQKATGYAEAIAAIRGELTIEEAIEQTAFATRRLAKKQRTWFRADSRIEWEPLGSDDEAPTLEEVDALAQKLVKQWREREPFRGFLQNLGH